jgi:hypothetical protein
MKKHGEKCRYCKHWGVGVLDKRKATARWSVCEIPIAPTTIPVRQYMLDTQNGKMKWLATGDAIEGVQRGKIKAHTDFYCNNFERR